MTAPTPKATKELKAAAQGDPSESGSRPSSSRASVWIAVSGLERIWPRKLVGLIRGDALRLIDEGQFFVLFFGRGFQFLCFQRQLLFVELALRPHRDIFARRHGKRAGQQSRNAREQNKSRFCVVPAIPMTSPKLEIRPSFTPNTAARRLPPYP